MLEDYVIEKKFIEGDYSWIHLGIRKSDSAEVAVKFSRESDDSTVKRFIAENEVLRRFTDHDNFVTAHTDVFKGIRENKEKYCYVMECIRLDLDGWLSINYDRKDNYKERIGIVIEILKAISTYHGEGYVHRDLHYRNVMVQERGMIAIPKLTDFGRVYNSRNPLSISKKSKPAWGGMVTPPEISFGVIDHKDEAYKSGDIYAAGLLLQSVFTDGIDVFAMLEKMHQSIARFKAKKVTGDYFSNRSVDEISSDFREWCLLEEERNPRRYTVELGNEAKILGGQLSEIIKTMSRLNYAQREVSIDNIIKMLEEL